MPTAEEMSQQWKSTMHPTDRRMLLPNAPDMRIHTVQWPLIPTVIKAGQCIVALTEVCFIHVRPKELVLHEPDDDLWVTKILHEQKSLQLLASFGMMPARMYGQHLPKESRISMDIPTVEPCANAIMRIEFINKGKRLARIAGYFDCFSYL